MNLNEALHTLADYFNVSADELKSYAKEDNVGGWDDKNNGEETRIGNPLWEVGSIWEVEGKILYTLIRVLKPTKILEIGSYHGCSTSHICEALLKNGNGKLISLDNATHFIPPPQYQNVLEQIREDVYEYQFPKRSKIDFVFEDSTHDEKSVAHIWSQFKANGKEAGVIISHDAEHFDLGKSIQRGIANVTSEAKTMLIDPSDCGIAYWKLPKAKKKPVKRIARKVAPKSNPVVAIVESANEG